MNLFNIDIYLSIFLFILIIFFLVYKHRFKCYLGDINPKRWKSIESGTNIDSTIKLFRYLWSSEDYSNKRIRRMKFVLKLVFITICFLFLAITLVLLT